MHTSFGLATSVREIKVRLTFSTCQKWGGTRRKSFQTPCRIRGVFFPRPECISKSRTSPPLTRPRDDLTDLLDPGEEKKSHLRICGLKLVLIMTGRVIRLFRRTLSNVLRYILVVTSHVFSAYRYILSSAIVLRRCRAAGTKTRSRQRSGQRPYSTDPTCF